MLATPLSSDHIVLGHLAFIVVRCVVGAAVFLVVAALLGAVASPWAVVAVVAAGLIGLAHAAPMYLVATRTETDVPFTLGMRLVIMPLFLFSGTFFPVSLLPGWLQPVAWATPLWHGVELARAATLGRLEALPALGHTAYLVLVCVVFVQLSRRGLRRRLVT
jgi:lipooligosaccharide transport system permease protein